MIKAVLFDLDETIIMDEPVSLKAFAAAADLGAHNTGADAVRLAQRAGEIARRLWQESKHYPYCVRIGHSAWEGLWARYDALKHPTMTALRNWAPVYRATVWWEALLEQGIAVGDLLPTQMASHFWMVRREYPRYPDIDAVLDALAGRYKLGIVTNGLPDLQREKLAGSGVAHLFQAAVVSGEIDCGKPDPGIFRHICAQLGVELAECVMVGDNPGRDVAGAMNAGMPSVWAQRGLGNADPRYPGDLACSDLREMLPWLESL